MKSLPPLVHSGGTDELQNARTLEASHHWRLLPETACPTDLTALAKGKRVSIPVNGATKSKIRRHRGLVKVSLGTKDKQEAKQRYRETDSALQEFWRMLKDGPKRLSHKEIIAIAGLSFKAFVAPSTTNRGSPSFGRRAIWFLLDVGAAGVFAARWYFGDSLSSLMARPNSP